MGFAELLAAGDRLLRQRAGDTVTYAPTLGAPVTVQGIFDAEYLLAEVGQPGVSSAAPAVFLGLEDLPSDPETDTGATVTVGGVTYAVREVRPDSKGGVLLVLTRA